jgi:hypothetical protein
MTYFTSWDVNVFLCLLSLGLPGDLTEIFVKKIKRVHRKFELEGARDFHCDRGKFVDMTKHQMLYLSRADLYDQEWHFPKAISQLESIPLEFYDRYSLLVDKVSEINRYYAPNNRVNYFKQSGPGGAEEWSIEMIKWFEGFHPGRFLLMDYEFIISVLKWNWGCERGWRVNGTREFVDWYNYVFKGRKKHIEDLL